MATFSTQAILDCLHSEVADKPKQEARSLQPINKSLSSPHPWLATFNKPSSTKQRPSFKSHLPMKMSLNNLRPVWPASNPYQVFASNPYHLFSNSLVVQTDQTKWNEQFKSGRECLDDFDREEEKRKLEEKQNELRQNFDTSNFPQEAREFVESAKNDKEIKNLEFFNFIEKISTGQIEVTEDGQLIVNDDESPELLLSQEWAREFVSHKNDAENDYQAQQQQQSEEADDTEFEWDYLSTNQNRGKETYEFAKDNPYKDLPDPFKEGLQKLEAGDIPSAVLHFEAACMQNPSEDLYWQFLGTTLASNEHDHEAILALEKCIHLNPDNLTALMGLAASHSNSNNARQACCYLYIWIKSNPLYQFSPVERPTSGNTTFCQIDYINEICDLFMNAARLQSEPIDADIQCGLGILLNLSGQYERAADCFEAALQVKPNDATLWNRLGASFANGSQLEKAGEAYKKALQIAPGFVRCRANLGIYFINLKKYKQALEQFLIVLNLQNAGQGYDGSTSTQRFSSVVWTYMRMALSLIDRQDLYKYVEERNLNALNSEFNFTKNDL